MFTISPERKWGWVRGNRRVIVKENMVTVDGVPAGTVQTSDDLKDVIKKFDIPGDGLFGNPPTTQASRASMTQN